MQRTEHQRSKVTLLSDGITTSDGFHKSTRSQGVSNCAEVKEGAVCALRDTQNRHLGALGFPASEWSALVGAAIA